MTGITSPKVFICYAKEDYDKAVRISEALKDIGVNPWLDRKILVLGEDYKKRIREAIRDCDAFVVCLSPEFVKTGFRQDEIRWAIEVLELRPPDRPFIIPFIIKPCEIPIWLNCLKSLHAGIDNTKATSIEELLVSIKKHLFLISTPIEKWKQYTQCKYAFDHKDFPTTEFELKAAQKIEVGSHVLDIGTGPGRFVDLAFKKGADYVVAIDPRHECHEIIIEKSDYLRKKEFKEKFRFIHGTWPEVYEILKHHKFDLVFSQSSLHYLDRDQRSTAFARVRWLLKSKGIFALAVKSIDNAWITVGDAERISKDKWRWHCKDGLNRTFFTIQGLIHELNSNSFKIKDNDYFSRIVKGYEWPGQLTVWHEIITTL